MKCVHFLDREKSVILLYFSFNDTIKRRQMMKKMNDCEINA